jgi:hypothetical protein
MAGNDVGVKVDPAPDAATNSGAPPSVSRARPGPDHSLTRVLQDNGLKPISLRPPVPSIQRNTGGAGDVRSF